MKKIKNFILASITTFITGLLACSAIHFSSSVKEAKADSLTNLGTVSIVGIYTYDPYWTDGANTNGHLILKLTGSDYPEDDGTDPLCVPADDVKSVFDHNISTHIEFKDRAGNLIYLNDYWELYGNQHKMGASFSFGIPNSALAISGMIKKGFKIPSYSLISGETSSPTYGYYTVDKTYYGSDIEGAVPRHEGIHEWSCEEYDSRNITVNALYSYVDGEKEFLTFVPSGGGLDYPTGNGVGNFHFTNSSIWNEILPNFKQKVHFYDDNDQEMTYDFAHLVSIDLWQLCPRVSVGIDILRQARYISIEPGLILPSYARHQEDTTSPVYDGFIVTNAYNGEVGQGYAHTTGAQIPWSPKMRPLSELTLANFRTQRPFTNTNVFFLFEFNELTDFSSAGRIQWPDGKGTLFSNIATHVEAYDASNNKLNFSVVDGQQYFNYTSDVSNEICVMLSNTSAVRRVVLKQGFEIPSLALYSGNQSSESYGVYRLACDYEITIDNYDDTQWEINVWNLPKCTVNYYDDNNTFLNSVSVVLGKTYELQAAPAVEGYATSWVIEEPEGLEIVDGHITMPLVVTTIKIKLHKELVPVCTIEYYDADGDLIEEYSRTAIVGTELRLEPVISKKGHDAYWEVFEPQGIEVVNNRITLPSVETTIKLRPYYVVRSYVISFEGLEAIVNVTFGQPIGQLPEVPPQTGMVGVWTIDGEAISEETIYNFDSNKTAVAQYSDRMCVITFVTNGGLEVEPIEILYGTSLSELPTTSKEGFYFNYWATDESLEHPYVLETVVEDDFTLYASWSQEVIVTFDTDGGSYLEPVSLPQGSKLDKPYNPTKEGYEFVCWKLNGSEFNFDNPITESITLVATWKKVETPKDDEDKEEKKENKPNVGLIAGVIAGSVVLVAGLAALVVILIKRKK